MGYFERRLDRVEERIDRHAEIAANHADRLTKVETSRGTWGYLIALGLSVLALVAQVTRPLLGPSEPSVIYVTEDEMSEPVQRAKVGGETIENPHVYQLSDGTTVLRSGRRRWFVRGGKARLPDGSEVPVEIEQ